MKALTTLICASAALLPAATQAGVYTDDVSRCLVAKASDADKATLIQGIFAAISVNPAVKDLAVISDAKRTQATQKAGALIGRLMTVDCRKEMIAALKYEGTPTVGASFEVLGRVAMVGLMNHPDVNKQMVSIGEGADKAQMQGLFKEAGVPIEGNKPAPTQK